MTQSKNLWVLPTDKPSRLYLTTHEYIFEEGYSLSTDECENKHIYITSDKEIKPNIYCFINGVLCKTELLEDKIVSRQLPGGATMDVCKSEYSEIILTTDQELIKDGVQAIPDEFLEWFVKNPSCERVEVQKWFDGVDFLEYKIIIPKEEPKTVFDQLEVGKDYKQEVFELGEEPKQETLEEAKERYLDSPTPHSYRLAVEFGAKWQQEQILDFLYSEITERRDYSASKMCEKVIEFIEQFKKK